MAGRSTVSTARLLEFLVEHPVITVVREGQDGDRHEPHPTASAPDGAGVTSVPLVLEQFDRERLVERVERVHPHDTSEHLVTWQRVAIHQRARGAGRDSLSIRDGVTDRSAALASGDGGRP
jgi:hypothetical protein